MPKTMFMDEFSGASIGAGNHVLTLFTLELRKLFGPPGTGPTDPSFAYPIDAVIDRSLTQISISYNLSAAQFVTGAVVVLVGPENEMPNTSTELNNLNSIKNYVHLLWGVTFYAASNSNATVNTHIDLRTKRRLRNRNNTVVRYYLIRSVTGGAEEQRAISTEVFYRMTREK